MWYTSFNTWKLNIQNRTSFLNSLVSWNNITLLCIYKCRTLHSRHHPILGFISVWAYKNAGSRIFSKDTLVSYLHYAYKLKLGGHVRGPGDDGQLCHLDNYWLTSCQLTAVYYFCAIHYVFTDPCTLCRLCLSEDYAYKRVHLWMRQRSSQWFIVTSLRRSGAVYIRVRCLMFGGYSRLAYVEISLGRGACMQMWGRMRHWIRRSYSIAAFSFSTMLHTFTLYFFLQRWCVSSFLA